MADRGVIRSGATASAGRSQRVGLVAGIAAAALLILLPSPTGVPEAAWTTAAVGSLMAIWWMSEAVPLAVTALVPLILFPLLGIDDFTETAASYANPLIFLFLGGFVLAKALERWQLHRRLANLVMIRASGSPGRLLAGLMAVTAFLSMWVSNTATAMVMLPIAQSVISALDRAPRDQGSSISASFGPAIMLGIAYSATIGGMGTLIGTPPNAFFAAFLKNSYGINVDFATWMLVGMPAVFVLLPATYLILTRIAFRLPVRLPDAALADARLKMDPMHWQEWTVTAVMVAVALTWIFRPVAEGWWPRLALSDAGIAMAGALLLFIIPDGRPGDGRLLEWADLKGLRWDVLILFGGGLALAAAINTSGLADWIGTGMTALAWLPASLLVLTVMVVIVYLGELASNTAMAAVFLPVAAAAATGLGTDPIALTLPVVLAASLGFMLPVATPPNAIVFGSGALSATHMLRAGAILDVVSIGLVYAVAMTVGRWVFLP